MRRFDPARTITCLSLSALLAVGVLGPVHAASQAARSAAAHREAAPKADPLPDAHEAGRGWGFDLAYSRAIVAYEAKAAQMDREFNFKGLLIEFVPTPQQRLARPKMWVDHGKAFLLPPVMTDPATMRRLGLGDKSQEARGASLVEVGEDGRPNFVAWRDYFPYPKPGDAPVDASKPPIPAALSAKPPAARQAWMKEFEAAEAEALESAGLMVDHDFDELRNDYQGMARFNAMHARGEVGYPPMSSWAPSM